MKFTTVFIGLVAMAAALPAATISFAGGGSLGASHSFGGVTATAYLNNNVTGTLFGKGTAGSFGSEDGLGITADPSRDNEIFAPGTDFIQLDISSLSGIIQISMGSTGGSGNTPDIWAVYGGTTSGTLGSTLLASGTNDDGVEITVPGAKTYQFLDIKATSGNVLLQDLNIPTSVPEPSTFGIVGLGGVLLGLLRRKRTQN